MERQTVHWKQPGAEINADPGATIGLNRGQWERVGAAFELVDDGDGETPGLAVLEVADGDATLAAGVLDYGAAETFLLVPGVGSNQRRNLDIVITALIGSGALRQQDVLDRVPHEAESGDDEAATLVRDEDPMTRRSAPQGIGDVADSARYRELSAARRALSQAIARQREARYAEEGRVAKLRHQRELLGAQRRYRDALRWYQLEGKGVPNEGRQEAVEVRGKDQ